MTLTWLILAACLLVPAGMALLWMWLSGDFICGGSTSYLTDAERNDVDQG